MRAWIPYSLLRIGIFVALLVLLQALGVDWWLAAILAALLALGISYLVLGRLRDRVAAELAEARERRRREPTDEDVE